MSKKYYKFRIFTVYCSYKIHLDYKKNWNVSILSGLICIVS